MALLTGIALAVAEDEVDEVDEVEVEDGDEVNESAVPASAELDEEEEESGEDVLAGNASEVTVGAGVKSR